MKLRVFKTYSTKHQYYSINFFPIINIDWFWKGDKVIFIGWLVFGLQIKF